jgi:hypothetical protein
LARATRTGGDAAVLTGRGLGNLATLATLVYIIDIIVF